MRMAPVQPRRVGQNFLCELSKKILTGKSVVLLGPRYSGKGYCLCRLRQCLQTAPVGRIISLELFRQTSVTTDAELLGLLQEAIKEAGEELEVTASEGSFITPLLRLKTELNQPCLLFVTNIDRMAHHLAR